MLTMYGVDFAYCETTIYDQKTRTYPYRADWNKIRSYLFQGNPLDFYIVRASIGSYTDVAYQRTLPYLRQVDADTGAYGVFWPGVSVALQVDVYVKNWAMFPFSLVPILDLEVPGADPDLVYDWLRRVEMETKRRPMIYTRKYYWEDCICKHDRLGRPIAPGWTKDYFLWDANPTTASSPLIPTGWKTYDMWQYSWKGLIPGFLGEVDMNRCPEDRYKVIGGTVRRPHDGIPSPIPGFPKTCLVVASVGLNVRLAPNTLAQRIEAIPCNTKMTATEEVWIGEDRWMRVRTPSGKMGWACRLYKGSQLAMYL